MLAKAYLKLNDKENAQMYCDMGLQNALLNELVYLQVRLMLLKSDIESQRLPQQTEKEKLEFAQNVVKMYNKTIEIAKNINLENYVKIAQKKLTAFKAYCQLNRIIVDK